MDQITCKHCGTKYPADVAKCPLCGASNVPSVSEGFEFLDDEFEATAKPKQPAPKAKAPAAPETPAAPKAPAAPETQKTEASKPAVSQETGNYNWEDIIAEINGTKPAESEAAPAAQPAAPKEAVPAVELPSWRQNTGKTVPQPEAEDGDEDEDDEFPPRRRERRRGAGKAVAIVLVLAVLAGGIFAAKHFGLIDKLTGSGQTAEEPETPELPVEQEKDVKCTGLTLSEATLTLTKEGDTQQLTAALQPADCTEKVNWVSADPSVAAVDGEGRVTALKEGTSNILASCGDYAATCLVTVQYETAEPENPEDQPGEGGETAPTGEPELSNTDITMTYPGELARLYVNNIADDETVTWSTENETILTVDSTGLIMARGTGTTHVYAEVAGTKLECIVRCNLGGPEGERITVSLNATDISMFYKGETFQFKVSYENGEPEGATYEWKSSDEAVCTVDENGVVTAVGNGNAYVSTTANGVTLKCVVRVNIKDTGSSTEG